MKFISFAGKMSVVFQWVPRSPKSILDIGCSTGEDLRYLVERYARRGIRGIASVGIDTNGSHIRRARERFPQMQFEAIAIERFSPRRTFDFILMLDVLEHVRDEVTALNAVARLLAPGGTLVITVPHRGLFAFLDTANYKFRLRRIAPRLFNAWVRRKLRKNPRYQETLQEGEHRHYTLKEIRGLLDRSQFGNRYVVRRVLRSGLLVGVLATNLRSAARLLVGAQIADWLVWPLRMLSLVDYGIPYGRFAYNVAVAVQKM